MSLLPLTVSLFVLQKVLFHLERRRFARMVKGFLYAFIGLIVFLVGVYGGFMEIAGENRIRLAMLENKVWVVVTAFALGFFTILAEPAVYVLTHTIEEVTSGYVKRKAVGAALSIGVGSAVALAMSQDFDPRHRTLAHSAAQLYHCCGHDVLPPNLFVGIAFGAGGVATGPLSATFILAFVQGAGQRLPGAKASF